MSEKLKEMQKSWSGAANAALQEAYDLGRREGIQVGVQMGVEREAQRVKEMLFPQQTRSGVPDPPMTPDIYVAGTFMNMARMMLAKDRKRTFGIQDVVEYFDEHYKVSVDADQVRSLLKVLSRQDEAERTERGIYRAGPRLENPTSFLGSS